MSFNMSITRPDGSVWLSPDQTPFCFIEKINFLSPGTYVTKVPVSKQIVCFAKVSGMAPIVMSYGESNGYNTVNITKGGSGTLYVFSNYEQNSGEYGIAFYDKSGAVVYSAESKPLVFSSIETPIVQTGTFHELEIGYECAVLPAMVHQRVIRFGANLNWLIGFCYSSAYGTKISSVIEHQVEVMSWPDVETKFKKTMEYIKISDYD